MRRRSILFLNAFCREDDGEIALETEMTYYQVRWVYRQALEKMRDSLRG